MEILQKKREFEMNEKNRLKELSKQKNEIENKLNKLYVPYVFIGDENWEKAKAITEDDLKLSENLSEQWNRVNNEYWQIIETIKSKE